MSEARSVYREAFQHFAKGELEEAIAGYQRAIELDDKFPIRRAGNSAEAQAQRRISDRHAAMTAFTRAALDVVADENRSIPGR